MTYNDSMSYGYSKKRKSKSLLIIAILLLLGGVALLLVDPIKNHLRNQKVEEAIDIIQSGIPTNVDQNADPEELEEAVITMQVPKDAYEVDGEEYDYFGANEIENSAIGSELDQAYEDLPNYVTLVALGILDIDSVDIHIPIWSEASVVSLRYGGGHFINSAMPGDRGNCSILAHHMRHADTMFHNLDKVQIGDTIRVTSISGRVYNYIADEILIVSARELPNYLEGDITDTKQITLVTCTYTSTGKMRLLVIGHIDE